MTASTSTTEALFSKNGLTGERVGAMDMVSQLFQHFYATVGGLRFPREDLLFLLSEWWWY